MKIQLDLKDIIRIQRIVSSKITHAKNKVDSYKNWPAPDERTQELIEQKTRNLTALEALKKKLGAIHQQIMDDVQGEIE